MLITLDYIHRHGLGIEETVRENRGWVDWGDISRHHICSEEFIKEFRDYVSWFYISSEQRLSEGFIREFKDSVDWESVSKYQNLSEGFIREFQDSVHWNSISGCQKLSEEFIREFRDRVSWSKICTYQRLSEEFIKEFRDKVHDYRIIRAQVLSVEFREVFPKIPETCWLYRDVGWKESYIRKNTSYPIENGIVIAYKSCRSDGYSKFNFQYKYEVGREYQSTADYNSDEENSFGLSAWTKVGALGYCSNGKLFKVGIKLEDIACIIHEGNKIRATKIKILENVGYKKCYNLEE